MNRNIRYTKEELDVVDLSIMRIYDQLLALKEVNSDTNSRLSAYSNHAEAETAQAMIKIVDYRIKTAYKLIPKIGEAVGEAQFELQKFNRLLINREQDNE